MSLIEHPILECGQTPEPGKLYTLIESFIQNFAIVHDPYTVAVSESGQILESRKPGKEGEGLMRIRGVYQCENKKNANKRTYPTGLWEKHTKPDSDLMRKVSDSRCIGQIEHPKDGVGSLRDTAIKTVRLWMGEKQADGSRPVFGESEICDTPEGRIVRDLLRSGVKIGISSRGTGTIKPNGEVDESTFRPETWDVVGNPSTPGAFPNVVTESIGNQVRVETYRRGNALEWRMIDEATNREVSRVSTLSTPSRTQGVGRMAREHVESRKRSVEALLATPITNKTDDMKKLDDALEESAVRLIEECDGDNGLRTAIADPLLKRITGKREAILEATSPDGQNRVEESDGIESEDDLVDDEQPEEGDEDVAEAAVGDLATIIERVEADPAGAAALLQQAYDELSAAEESIAAMESDMEEAEQVLSEQQDTNAALLEQINNLNETIATQTTLLRRITASEKEVAEGVGEAIEKAIAAHPALANVRGIIERCATVEEVRVLVESIAPKSDGKPSAAPKAPAQPIRKDLPLTESVKPTAEAQKSDGSTSSTGDSKKPMGVRLADRLIERRVQSLTAPSLTEQFQQQTQQK